MAAFYSNVFIQEGIIMIIVEAALLLPQESYKLLEIPQTEFTLIPR